MSNHQNSVPRVEEIQCCVCGKTGFVAIHDAGGSCRRTWVAAHSLPEGWFVTDSFPPGDDGLWFACSVECTERYDG